MSRAAWIWFIPGAAAFFAGLYFRARRWSLLMDGTPLGITWHAMLIGYMLNMSLPLRLGEVARAWVIGQHHSHLLGGLHRELHSCVEFYRC